MKVSDERLEAMARSEGLFVEAALADVARELIAARRVVEAAQEHRYFGVMRTAKALDSALAAYDEATR